MGRLTTHILDISAGVPAAGVRIDLHALGAMAPKLLASVTTGIDGRCPGPLIAEADFRTGRYSLRFHLAEYFRRRGVALPEPAFIDTAVVEVGIAEPAGHYHVPLLIAPWSYTVYRGG
jgi:hydroxyisourate hydrolase